MKGVREKDMELREKQRQTTVRIKEMVKESSMKKVFDKYSKQLQIVFKHFIDSQTQTIGSGHALDTLQFLGYTAFAADFNILPGIVPLQEVKLLFNSMTSTKEVSANGLAGINYDEFLESLMRISIKGREKLDKVYDIKRRIKEAKSKEAQKAAEDELEDERGNEHKEQEGEDDQDNYEEIEGTTKNTLEGLLFYLDMPEDKTELINKLHFLKESRPKNWKEKKNCTKIHIS